MIGGERVILRDCPPNLVTGWARRMLRRYGHWTDGRLWYPGSLCEQPAKYVQAMEIISSELANIRRREREDIKGKR